MIRMKISERFALNQWLSSYPNDKAYDEVLSLVRETDDSVKRWYLIEYCTAWDAVEFIEETRKAFEDSSDDLCWGISLHDVREGDLDDYE